MDRLRKSLGSFIDDEDIECFVSSGNIRIWDQETKEEDGVVAVVSNEVRHFCNISWTVVLVVVVFGGVQLYAYIHLLRSKRSKETYARNNDAGIISKMQRTEPDNDQPTSGSQQCHPEHCNPWSHQHNNIMVSAAATVDHEAQVSMSAKMKNQNRSVVTQEIDISIQDVMPINVCRRLDGDTPAQLSSLPKLSDEPECKTTMSHSLNLVVPNKKPEYHLTSNVSLLLEETLQEAAHVAQTIQMAQVVFDRHGVDRNLASMWALRHQESQRQREEDHRKEMDRRRWDVMQRNTEQHLSQLRHQETISALRHNPKLMDKIQAARDKCWRGLTSYCVYYIPLSTLIVVCTNRRNVQAILRLLLADTPVHEKVGILLDVICRCSGRLAIVDDHPLTVDAQCHSWLYCNGGGMFNYLVSSSALLQSYGSCLLWIACFFLLHRVLRLLSMPPAIFHVVNVVPIITFLSSEIDDVPIHFFVLWIGPQLIIAAWLAWVVGNEARNTPNTPNESDELEKNLVAYSRWEERIRLLPVFAIAVAVGASLHFLIFGRDS